MRHHISKVPSREYEVRFPRLTRDPFFDRVDPPRVFLSLGGGGSSAGKSSSYGMDLAENRRLMCLFFRWRRQGGGRCGFWDIILQKPGSHQLIQLVTQRKAVINVVTESLVELTPRVFPRPQHLIGLRRSPQSLSYIRHGDQVLQFHHKIVSRRPRSFSGQAIASRWTPDDGRGPSTSPHASPPKCRFGPTIELWPRGSKKTSFTCSNAINASVE